MTAEAMYPVPSWPETPRVYVDSSVFSACENEKYWIRESSRKLLERFRAGDMTLVLSAAVAGELESATEAARALPGTVPREYSEFLEPSGAAEELADRYIEAGAATRPVALHVAFATLANVDTLASWNHKHLLNVYRRPRFNAVNRELGHPSIEMYEPPAILGENYRDPNDKSFDCVGFMREQRDRISRKLETMTPEERVDSINNREITDPILRRILYRSRKVKLSELGTSRPDPGA
ncbi:MAG: hypothetical protein OXI49_13100 [Acidobacteriota bacterium]|nr:hypothetical protein [Acidobacteriota bacterium]